VPTNLASFTARLLDDELSRQAIRAERATPTISGIAMTPPIRGGASAEHLEHAAEGGQPV
jgi:hypothetical protein